MNSEVIAELKKSSSFRKQTEELFLSLLRLSKLLSESPISVVCSILGGSLGALMSWFVTSVIAVPLGLAIPTLSIVGLVLGYLLGRGPRSIALEMKLERLMRIQRVIDSELDKATQANDDQRVISLRKRKVRTLNKLEDLSDRLFLTGRQISDMSSQQDTKKEIREVTEI